MEENKIIDFPQTQTSEAEDSVIDFDAVFGDLNMEDFGLNEFAAILSLPDDSFHAISETILDEIAKSLNNPTDRILIQQELLKSGYTAADIIKLQQDINEAIDAELAEQFPQDRLDFMKRAITMICNIYTEAEGTAKAIVSIPIEVMPYGIMPTYAHDGDAAMDIYSPEEYDVNPGETVLVKTGLKVAIPRGYGLLIQPRSGQSLKTKLRIANTPGLIDSGYRDEIGVILENIESPIKEIGETNGGAYAGTGNLYGKSYHIDKGQRIAQMRLVEVPTINWLPVENINEIEGDRGGGFGSSGE